MIKCNKKGEVILKGNVPDIMSDLSVITRGMREFLMRKGISKDEAEKDIKHAVEIGFWTEEELTKENDKLVKELVDLILGGTHDE